MAVDLDLVRHALAVARNGDFAKVELETPTLKFEAELARTPRSTILADDVLDEAGLLPTTPVITSPFVGYFASADPAVRVGDEVSEGDRVGSIQALGIGNDVIAPHDGVVEEVMVKEGDPVEYGQPLMRVKGE